MNAQTSSRIAAIQMVSGPAVEGNLEIAGRLLAEAAARGAQLAALPEYFGILGMKDTDKVAVRVPLGDGPIQRFLSDCARKHGVWLVGGSVPLVSRDPHRVLNTCLVFDPGGRQAARYDKIHLFGFEMGAEAYHEERTIEPGATPVTTDTPLGKLGLSICYDLRFPELYRAMKAIDIIFVPSAFTVMYRPAAFAVGIAINESAIMLANSPLSFMALTLPLILDTLV